MTPPILSVVIPVYNEEDGLPALFARLYPALDKLNVAYEILFTNDGSKDKSAAVLREQFQLRPDVTRVILFNGNYGQHMAIMAAFEHCRGSRIVTLDADLQNPPAHHPPRLAGSDADTLCIYPCRSGLACATILRTGRGFSQHGDRKAGIGSAQLQPEGSA